MTRNRSRSVRPPTVFSVIGLGRLGGALARRLSASSEYRLHGFTRRRGPVGAHRGPGRWSRDPADAVGPARLVFLCVPDRQLARLAERLARSAVSWRGRTVLHTSGLRDSTLLSPLADRGARIGSFHPLQTFTGGAGETALLSGCPIGFEGDRPARRVAARVARVVGGRLFDLPADLKPAYHLAACLLSNYLVSLTAHAVGLLEGEAGRGETDWIRLYGPLIERTLANLREAGTAASLTGPVSRGDLETLRSHMEVLSRGSRDTRDLHRVLALEAVKLARRAGRISASRAAVMRRLLRNEDSGKSAGRPARD